MTDKSEQTATSSKETKHCENSSRDTSSSAASVTLVAVPTFDHDDCRREESSTADLQYGLESSTNAGLKAVSALDDESAEFSENTTISTPNTKESSIIPQGTMDYNKIQQPSELVTNGSTTTLSQKAKYDVYPEPFYCPLTKELFQDPVVAPDGISYERRAIMETKGFDNEKLYSNRGLKQIIDDAKEKGKRLADTVKGDVCDNENQGTTDEPEPLPDGLHCPITFSVMHAPMIDPEGNTFEHVAIANWIHVNASSPTSRNPLSMDQLVPNRAIADLIQFETSKPSHLMHPSIRKFLTEQAPSMPSFEDSATTKDNDPSLSRFSFRTSLQELEIRRRLRQRLYLGEVLCAIGLVVTVVLAVFYQVSVLLFTTWLVYCAGHIGLRIWSLQQEMDAFARVREEEVQAQETQRQEWQAEQERHARLELDLEAGTLTTTLPEQIPEFNTEDTSARTEY